MLFETDFPHTTRLFGNIQETISAGLGHVEAGRGGAEDSVGDHGTAVPDQ
ncbi:hypothetical protein FMEAI12_4280051 [Parafrankia sp. Ea1.12]|nr:hypothetical protein FMEAI12_4280051 [Parafrankia sp. Ea1.12]